MFILTLQIFCENVCIKILLQLKQVMNFFGSKCSTDNMIFWEVKISILPVALLKNV